MIPIKDISFYSKRLDYGGLEVKAELSLHSFYTINREEVSHEMRELVKDLLLRSMWNHVYGEIIDPLNRLCDYAVINAPLNDQERVMELAAQLRRLAVCPAR